MKIISEAKSYTRPLGTSLMKNSHKTITSKDGKLKLSKSNLFWHYSIVPFLLLAPTIFLFYIIAAWLGNAMSRIPQEKLLTTTLFFIGFAILFFLIQYRRLNFKKIKVRLNTNEFKRITEGFSEKHDWYIMKATNDKMIAISKGSWRSWGERITIMNCNGEIWFNSICNPESRPSITSLGKNRKNYNDFCDAIWASAK